MSTTPYEARGAEFACARSKGESDFIRLCTVTVTLELRKESSRPPVLDAMRIFPVLTFHLPEILVPAIWIPDPCSEKSEDT